ncbi:unnamed protein product [Urochloa humidicola]
MIYLTSLSVFLQLQVVGRREDVEEPGGRLGSVVPRPLWCSVRSMASDSGKDQGHSINEDLRMQGLRGDDGSDLEADKQELFVWLCCCSYRGRWR